MKAHFLSTKSIELEAENDAEQILLAALLRETYRLTPGEARTLQIHNADDEPVRHGKLEKAVIFVMSDFVTAPVENTNQTAHRALEEGRK